MHAFFGNGTQLQEMYITPSLLDSQNWDDLAEAAKWSRANADVLVDTHWIGGDPGKGEVYGWASWSPRRRGACAAKSGRSAGNVHDGRQRGVPTAAARKQIYRMHSPWKADASKPVITLKRGEPHTFSLQPFQVLVLETK